MIVRKPYAFLIKNFKLIHFFMLIITTYILYKSNNIFSFFNEYVSTRQVVSTGTLSIQYVPFSLFIFSLLIILFSIIIMTLLKQKDKPNFLYFAIILFYFGFMIFCIFSRINISDIELEGIDPQKARIIRDISLIVFLVQLVYEVLLLVRTFGFDIRKFHFGEDLQSLQIDITDNEEVELTTGIDTDKLIRRIKMKGEDLKAFFLENKFVIIVLSTLLIVIIPFIFLFINSNNNKKYNENEIIDLSSYSLKVNSSYYTKYDYKGKKLLSGDSSYLIVNINITNYSDDKLGLSLNKFKLLINGNIYDTNETLYDSFIDLGNGYYSQKLNTNESKNYIILFVVNDEDLSSDVILRYTSNIKYVNSEAKPTYKKVLIKPKQLDVKKESDPVSINEEINFSDTLLKDTSLTITSYGIRNKYSYTLNDNTKYIINNNGYVLKLSYDFSLDSDISFITDFSEFITKYCQIEYVYNNVTYRYYASNITPSNYKDKDVYIAVNDNIVNSTSIKIIFNIRNNIFTCVIK